MRAGEGFTLFISNEDMNDISKSIKSLEDLMTFFREIIYLEQKMEYMG